RRQRQMCIRDRGWEVQGILQEAGVAAVPEAAVVTFVGTAADPIHGRTPWGELAHQLGAYGVLEEHDRRRRAPGKDRLHQLLGQRPTLILMDEIAEYAVKAKEFRDQVVAFFQELSETVKVVPQAVLVVTLPSSAPYGEEGARALHELQEVFKRVETIRTPVEGEEIYEVIRRRLFEDMGDPREANQTAEQLFHLYQQLREDVPQEAREVSYRERLRKAYPFHPEVVDVLLERWSTFPDFQRTRGVLRLLANVVAELYQAKHQAPLILPAHINLANPAVRGELLRHIGNEYQGVIASDVAGGSAKAERLDREIGSEYARFAVASGLARAIFFASFSGGGKQGVSLQRLRLALLQPDLQPAIIADAMQRLAQELWYLHAEGGLYWFSSQPNLNRVLVEKEEALTPDALSTEIRNLTDRFAGNKPKVVVWPQQGADIPDREELFVAVLAPELHRRAPGVDSHVGELLRKCGQKFRTYQNAVLVVVAEEGDMAALRQHLRRLLAYRAIREDRALWRQLGEDKRREVENKLRSLEAGLDHRLASAYRHLARVGEEGVQWYDMGLPTSGTRLTLADRVVEFLRGEEVLVSKLAPQSLLRLALAHVNEKPVADLYRDFLRNPGFPLLESKEVLLQSLAQGVAQGLFGVRVGGKLFVREPVPSDAWEDAVVVVQPPEVEPPTLSLEPREVRESPPGSSEPPVMPVPTGEPSGPSPAQLTSYFLRVQVPWDKLSDFVRGVVLPLRQAGAELQLEVVLHAHAAQGFKEATLQHAVRETLQQIGAQVLQEGVGNEPSM
ncbi:MAG: ATP-binding protein, partial [Thermoanaerobaculum sp.]|nr:ATP-binding protein [Thermoanaerobaculum sp.]